MFSLAESCRRVPDRAPLVTGPPAKASDRIVRHARARGRAISPPLDLDDDGQATPGRARCLLRTRACSSSTARCPGPSLEVRLWQLQRQGRIYYALATTGQEASAIGSAAAVEKDNWVFPASAKPARAPPRLAGCGLLGPGYSETGTTCARTGDPVGLRRRLGEPGEPSPLAATKLPHAVASRHAMSSRRTGGPRSPTSENGATSPPDFHSALTFASVWRSRSFRLPETTAGRSRSVTKQTPARRRGEARAYGLPGSAWTDDLLAVHHARRKPSIERAGATAPRSSSA